MPHALLSPSTCYHVTGHFHLAWRTQHNTTICLNGPIHAICGILKHIITFAAEAKLDTLLHSMVMGKLCTLSFRSWKIVSLQPKFIVTTPLLLVLLPTLSKNHSHPIEMYCFWVVEKVDHKFFVCNGTLM